MQLIRKEKLVDSRELQKSLTIAQILSILVNQRASLFLSIATSKRSIKFSNSSIFIEIGDSFFENWSLKLQDKLLINANYFDTNDAKTIYVVRRIDNKVVEHINVYRVSNVVYFQTIDIILKVLKSVYDNSNRKRNVRVKYFALKQDSS